MTAGTTVTMIMIAHTITGIDRTEMIVITVITGIAAIRDIDRTITITIIAGTTVAAITTEADTIIIRTITTIDRARVFILVSRFFDRGEPGIRGPMR